ncbi:hypothetical protein I4U23_001546 [Adineta vaga]|nr:hypothetical protein I4U23_001546 [Adineta vaga]
MTSSSSSLNDLKIEIRSLLISSPTGLDENELSRDYARFNSQHSIPYQLFGYLTLTDFLNSLTDILYRSKDGMFYPIVDQSTEHIFKFVQQQRSKKEPPIKHKRAMSTMNTSSRQIHFTDDAKKPFPLMKQMRIITESKVKHDVELSRNYTSTPRFERINVTNGLLRNLLIHFQQQQLQPTY